MSKIYESEREQFSRKGYCILDVNHRFQDSLRIIEYDLNSATKDDWTYVIKHKDFEGDLPTSTYQDALNNHRKEAFEENSQGVFSFFFQRMTTEDLACSLPHRQLRSSAIVSSRLLMESTEMRDLLKSISGRKVNDIEQLYINKFDVGDFLGIHRDGGNNLGVALNITRGWLTTNGGNTHIVDDDLNIIDSLSPKFGKLLVFDSMKENVPHFVSTVSGTNGSSRMAIVARYN